MLYAAYGSNLNKNQMAVRCPNSTDIGTALIPDYRLMFKGSLSGSYLTIEPAEGYSVPVGIWDIDGRDLGNLDRYEGYPRFYYRRNFVLPCSDGLRHRVFAYIMHEERVLSRPSLGYVEACLKGYDDFGFDPEYLREAYNYTVKGGKEFEKKNA